MVKYTHIIEPCNSLLRTGVSWRLKTHGYTMSAAYWRLREGKGLVSLYDQETFRLCSNLITAIRRFMGSPIPMTKTQYLNFKELKEQKLSELESYRTIIEAGIRPYKFSDGIEQTPIERVITGYIGNEFFDLSPEEEMLVWKKIDSDFDNFLKKLSTEQEKYLKEWEAYNNLPLEKQKTTLKPGSGEDLLLYNKVWQIRTDFEKRSSKGAKINETLLYIWEIPSQTDESHRSLLEEIQQIVDDWKIYKKDIKDLKMKKRFVEHDTIIKSFERALCRINSDKLLSKIKPSDS